MGPAVIGDLPGPEQGRRGPSFTPMFRLYRRGDQDPVKETRWTYRPTTLPPRHKSLASTPSMVYLDLSVFEFKTRRDGVFPDNNPGPYPHSTSPPYIRVTGSLVPKPC